MRLKYADFYEEQLEVRGLKKAQCPEFIKMEVGHEVSLTQTYEFLEGKHCPNAYMASIWEAAFKVNLPPKYYTTPNGLKATGRKGGAAND